MLNFIKSVLQIAKKDIQIEWRTREMISQMIVFGILVVLIFSVTLGEAASQSPRLAAGVLWVAILFIGTLGFSRAVDQDRDDDAFSAILLSNIHSNAIFLGKLLGMFVWMLLVEGIMLPLTLMFFNVSISSWGLLLCFLMAGTIGIAVLGVLFAVSLITVHHRSLLLSVLLLPLVLPVVMAGALGTQAIISEPSNLPIAWIWLKIIGIFDAIFIIVSLMVFHPFSASE